MDFIFAAFPWLITWNLAMKKSEKIGISIVMSLGMVIAIESAIRTQWKYEGNPKDIWYFWRNGMSDIWYSSEVAGTIIVQCIPVLRTLLESARSTYKSRTRASTTEYLELERPQQQRYSMKANGYYPG